MSKKTFFFFSRNPPYFVDLYLKSFNRRCDNNTNIHRSTINVPTHNARPSHCSPTLAHLKRIIHIWNIWGFALILATVLTCCTTHMCSKIDLILLMQSYRYRNELKTCNNWYEVVDKASNISEMEKRFTSFFFAFASPPAQRWNWIYFIVISKAIAKFNRICVTPTKSYLYPMSECEWYSIANAAQ